MIRTVENNDWVILTFLAIMILYIIVFKVLLGDLSLKEFILMDHDDSSKIYLTWLPISLAYIIIISVLFSQYILSIPQEISIQIYGYKLNKFGMMFFTLSTFYVLKLVLTKLFYLSTGEEDKAKFLGLVAQKFYLVVSIPIMILCFMHYYFPVSKEKMMTYYIFLVIFLKIIKVFLYLFHETKPLPEAWYYKILYICIFQILPLLVLWKFLFVV